MPEFRSLQVLLEKHFPESLDPETVERFRLAFEAYLVWNAQINVISRKDIDNLAERHFLHSLAIAKSIRFLPGTKVLDAGTGGGFPGIPLAILHPETAFMLVDSREKKIKVVQEVAKAAGLKNVQSTVQRVEQLGGQYDFVLSRAVAPLSEFIPWVRKRIHCRSRHALENGILYLRGGDFAEELKGMGKEAPRHTAFAIGDMFEGEFFASKYLVHLTFCGGE